MDLQSCPALRQGGQAFKALSIWQALDVSVT